METTQSIAMSVCASEMSAEIFTTAEAEPPANAMLVPNRMVDTLRRLAFIRRHADKGSVKEEAARLEMAAIAQLLALRLFGVTLEEEEVLGRVRFDVEFGKVWMWTPDVLGAAFLVLGSEEGAGAGAGGEGRAL